MDQQQNQKQRQLQDDDQLASSWIFVTSHSQQRLQEDQPKLQQEGGRVQLVEDQSGVNASHTGKSAPDKEEALQNPGNAALRNHILLPSSCPNPNKSEEHAASIPRVPINPSSSALLLQVKAKKMQIFLTIIVMIVNLKLCCSSSSGTPGGGSHHQTSFTTTVYLVVVAAHTLICSCMAFKNLVASGGSDHSSEKNRSVSWVWWCCVAAIPCWMVIIATAIWRYINYSFLVASGVINAATAYAAAVLKGAFVLCGTGLLLLAGVFGSCKYGKTRLGISLCSFAFFFAVLVVCYVFSSRRGYMFSSRRRRTHHQNSRTHITASSFVTECPDSVCQGSPNS